MFGTLVLNEVSAWKATLIEVAREQALPVPGPVFWEEWSKREVSFRKTRTNMTSPEQSPPFRTYWEAWRDTFAEAFEALGIEGDPDAGATRSVEALCDRPAFPDSALALQALSSRYRLAVLSNADDVFLDSVLTLHGWQGLFEAVLSSEGARAYKPDPRAFTALCERTGVEPGEVLYVGDSPYDDAHGARLAGMRAALLRRDQETPGRTPPPETGELLSPDAEVASLAELAAVLMEGAD